MGIAQHKIKLYKSCSTALEGANKEQYQSYAEQVPFWKFKGAELYYWTIYYYVKFTIKNYLIEWLLVGLALVPTCSLWHKRTHSSSAIISNKASKNYFAWKMKSELGINMILDGSIPIPLGNRNRKKEPEPEL